MRVTKATIKRLYVDAIMKYQHLEDEKKIRKDVHTGGKGQVDDVQLRAPPRPSSA